jgi:hypothetical protein
MWKEPEHGKSQPESHYGKPAAKAGGAKPVIKGWFLGEALIPQLKIHLCD